MSYNCKILLDSISETGKRITTFELTFPRIILAEFNTHRMFSRNSASSRAIPFIRTLKMAEENPFIPERFPINNKGMQPNKFYENNCAEYDACKYLWLRARDNAINTATVLASEEYIDTNHSGFGIHKQIVNRLLEPFQWHTVICTATEFDNFFKLRCDENAQYEIRRIADLMYEEYHSYNPIMSNNKYYPPQLLKVGEWHCPLVSEEDDEAILNYLRQSHYSFKLDSLKKQELAVYGLTAYYLETKKKISVARCARVSYLTHDGKRDIEKDLELFERLRTSGHYSPFEHVATPLISMNGKIVNNTTNTYHSEYPNAYENVWSANFLGWRQYRKDLPDENCIHFKKEV